MHTLANSLPSPKTRLMIMACLMVLGGGCTAAWGETMQADARTATLSLAAAALMAAWSGLSVLLCRLVGTAGPTRQASGRSVMATSC